MARLSARLLLASCLLSSIQAFQLHPNSDREHATRRHEHTLHELPGHDHEHDAQLQAILAALPAIDDDESAAVKPKVPVSPIPNSTRAYWMKHALSLVPLLSDPPTPCPFQAFVSVVVNHTLSLADPTYLGDFVCSAINAVPGTGNPTLHGEVAGIAACTEVLSAPPYSLGPDEVLGAFSNLSLYTTAEPCAMCSGAILWAGFAECIYGTNNSALGKMGWPTIMMSSKELVGRAWALGTNITFFGNVLSNETDALFDWQYKGVNGTCPSGCGQVADGETVSCAPL